MRVAGSKFKSKIKWLDLWTSQNQKLLHPGTLDLQMSCIERVLAPREVPLSGTFYPKDKLQKLSQFLAYLHTVQCNNW